MGSVSSDTLSAKDTAAASLLACKVCENQLICNEKFYKLGESPQMSVNMLIDMLNDMLIIEVWVSNLV